MQWVKAFVAGFLATLVFHQGLLALLHAAAVVPVSPYNWAPSAPLGVPAVLSLAFWGGVWGLPLWWLIRFKPAHLYWSVAVLFGCGPTAAGPRPPDAEYRRPLIGQLCKPSPPHPSPPAHSVQPPQGLGFSMKKQAIRRSLLDPAYILASGGRSLPPKGVQHCLVTVPEP
mgnify:CR=1 FL=1